MEVVKLLQLAEPRDDKDEDNDEDYYDDDDDDDDNKDQDDNDKDDDDNEDDHEWKALVRERPLTMEKRECFGMDSVMQEELQVAIKVLYLQEFHSPPKSEWGNQL
jgi:ABC-type Zn2+ transport system substrate-binding protein/surface adhesin